MASLFIYADGLLVPARETSRFNDDVSDDIVVLPTYDWPWSLVLCSGTLTAPIQPGSLTASTVTDYDVAVDASSCQLAYPASVFGAGGYGGYTVSFTSIVYDTESDVTSREQGVVYYDLTPFVVDGIVRRHASNNQTGQVDQAGKPQKLWFYFTDQRRGPIVAWSTDGLTLTEDATRAHPDRPPAPSPSSGTHG